jgi:hypothetical protein
MKNGNKKIFLFSTVAILLLSCGQQISGHTKSLMTTTAAGAAGSATSTTPTVIQGFWQANCSNGVIMSWEFQGNGFDEVTDTYASNDCSDDNYTTETSQLGTFQIASTNQALLLNYTSPSSSTQTIGMLYTSTELLLAVPGQSNEMLYPQTVPN